ncbi:MAG: hypothetical protein SFT92_07875 [Rickettsiales bacterium]|nr:hypothetical protein [Rickettsiales bacterium]
MADSIINAAGPFDTAAMQIALAKAHAAAGNGTEETFLREIAKSNEETNAHALDSTNSSPPPANNGFDNALLGVDPDAEPVADPLTGPFIDPSIDVPEDPLAFLTEMGSDTPTVATNGTLNSQQLHDLSILQRDAELLEEAANENTPIPLGNGASTVDLSQQAQDIVSETAAPIDETAPISEAQLSRIATILQPVANEPLTPALLEQLQTQLNIAQQSTQLSLNTMIRAMNFIAGMQTSLHQAIEPSILPTNREVTVMPATAIDRAAVEDSAIR